MNKIYHLDRVTDNRAAWLNQNVTHLFNLLHLLDLCVFFLRQSSVADSLNRCTVQAFEKLAEKL